MLRKVKIIYFLNQNDIKVLLNIFQFSGRNRKFQSGDPPHPIVLKYIITSKVTFPKDKSKPHSLMYLALRVPNLKFVPKRMCWIITVTLTKGTQQKAAEALSRCLTWGTVLAIARRQTSYPCCHPEGNLVPQAWKPRGRVTFAPAAFSKRVQSSGYWFWVRLLCTFLIVSS